PNPSANIFNVTLPHTSAESVVVLYDALGREVFRKNLFEAESNFTFGTELTNGHYLLKWISGSEIKTVKLVKE
ncbi:MAG: T9SS type A sorting domain-containing protein, partial [Cytophagaceae bacterium]|nr:T9SS type A sorting domain-containing protein [Cytophagaceae bacterium]